MHHNVCLRYTYSSRARKPRVIFGHPSATNLPGGCTERAYRKGCINSFAITPTNRLPRINQLFYYFTGKIDKSTWGDDHDYEGLLIGIWRCIGVHSHHQQRCENHVQMAAISYCSILRILARCSVSLPSRVVSGMTKQFLRFVGR